MFPEFRPSSLGCPPPKNAKKTKDKKKKTLKGAATALGRLKKGGMFGKSDTAASADSAVEFAEEANEEAEEEHDESEEEAEEPQGQKQENKKKLQILRLRASHRC